MIVEVVNMMVDFAVIVNLMFVRVVVDLKLVGFFEAVSRLVEVPEVVNRLAVEP